MKTPFLLLNGDTLFSSPTLAKLLSGERIYPITLAVDRKHQYDDDDMKICADGERLLRVGKKLDASIVNGESIGMMIFNRAGAEAFVQKVEHVMADPEGLSRWYLSAIDELALADQVGISSIKGHDWCEVDDLADFAHAQKALRSWRENMLNTGAHSPNRVEHIRRKVA
jgi:choline kinase